MRARRHILACTAATALCVAMLFLWGRSTNSYDAAGVNVARFGDGVETDMLIAIESNRSSVGAFVNIERNPATRPPDQRFNYGAMHGPAQANDELSSIAGFRYQWRTTSGHSSSSAFRFMVPYWALALLCAGLARRAWVRARRAQAALRDGLCASCGYDLRASDTRCPECGNAVRQRSRSAPARQAEEIAA